MYINGCLGFLSDTQKHINNMEHKPQTHEELAQAMKEFAEMQMQKGSKVDAFKALMDKYYKSTDWLLFDRACAKLTKIWEDGDDFIKYRFNTV